MLFGLVFGCELALRAFLCISFSGAHCKGFKKIATGGTIPSTDSGRNSRNSGLGRGLREQRAAFEEAFKNRFSGESSFSEADFWNLFPMMDSDSEESSGDSQDSSVPFRLGLAVFPPSSPPLQEVPESFHLGLAVFTPSINILPLTPPRTT